MTILPFPVYNCLVVVLNGALEHPGKRGKSMVNIKGQVARVLLNHAVENTDGRNRLTHRDIAEMLNTDWGKIHKSLRSLHDDGVIKIDGNRIIIGLRSLQKAAGVTVDAESRGG